jgi:hypothetical protein
MAESSHHLTALTTTLKFPIFSYKKKREKKRKEGGADRQSSVGPLD